MNKLKERVEGKTCFVLLGGASLENLRRVAQDFKDLDVCWCGMNFFNPAETHILQSIGKKFTFVFDISGIKNIIPYEKTRRIPRIEKFLKEQNGLFVTSYEVERNFNWAERSDIFKNYKDRISFVEDCMYINTIHNSLMGYLFVLTYCKVKDIYLFGCDGYQGEYVVKNALLSYFSFKEVKEEVEIASEGSMYLGLPSDTSTFNGSFKNLYLDYCTEKKLVPRNIYNVNKDSFITVFPKLDLEYSSVMNRGEKNE